MLLVHFKLISKYTYISLIYFAMNIFITIDSNQNQSLLALANLIIFYLFYYLTKSLILLLKQFNFL
jgi:hypothetical protein